MDESPSPVPNPSTPNLAPIVFKKVSGADVLSMELSPEEAFVLSQVEELEIAEAISSATGLSIERVNKHLARLEKAGAIASHDPERAVDETLSISAELQRRIIDMSLRLDTLTHFEVLGVPHGADRATVKSAYFSHISTFHPDKYFKKNLGDFTKRMEAIFQRMTEAHEVLSRTESRADYDAYLLAVGKTQPREPVRGLDESGLDDLERLLRQAEQVNDVGKTDLSGGSQPATRGVSSRPPPSSRRAIPPPLPSRAPGPAVRLSQSTLRRPKVSLKPKDAKARRQALARKLGRPVSEAPPPVEVDAQKNQARVAAVKDLKGRYEHRKEAIEDQRLSKYVAAAEQALKAGNPVSALNAVRIATGVGGGSESIRIRIDNLETEASKGLADSFLERGRYEESNGNYEEAARSYSRSARGRPSSTVLQSAAECYLKAGTELRQACELARQAVGIDGTRTELRLTLAKVYDAAGMQTSAIKELERAQQLAPNSDQIKQWLKRLRRGGV